MPLGMLAKDSIQDLEALLGRGESDEDLDNRNNKNKSSKLAHAPIPGGVAAVALPDNNGGRSGRAAGAVSQQQAPGGGGGQQYANPQQAQEDDSYAAAEPRAGGAYAGFRSDYHYGGHHDPHHGQYINTRGTAAASDVNNNYFDYTTPVLEYLAEKKPESKPGGLLNCIFPCIFGSSSSSNKRLEDEEIHHPYPSPDRYTAGFAPSQQQLQRTSTSSSSSSPVRNSSNNLGRAHSRDEDEISTNSDVLGEKLSDKERQAVLARLGLAQPDVEGSNEEKKKKKASSKASKDHQQDHQLQQQQKKNDSSDGSNGHRPQQEEEDALKEDSVRSHSSSSNQDVPPSPPTRTKDSASSSSSVKNKQHHTPKGGLLNGIPTYDASPLLAACEEEEERKRKPRKSILKRGSTINNSTGGDSSSQQVSGKQQGGGGGASSSGGSSKDGVSRRSLFPSYSTPAVKKRTNNHATFAPMARVVTVKSKNDMDHTEKSDIWWQKPDYEDFRRTGRIITRAMLEGGTEIWLQESCSYDKNDKNNGGGGSKASSSSSSGDTAKKNKSEAELSDDDDGDKDTRDGYAPGDKWWHRFGHSRRGLEHVVSFDEGRERQQNVRNAIHACLEEQLRQKRYKREDPDKLRIVSLNHTSWARDLAVASAASDADAVKSSFSTERKSREFYLLKLARKSPAASSARRVPEFMQPAVKVTMASVPTLTSTASRNIKTLKLDANTAAQIQFRRDRTKDALQQQQQQIQKDETSSAAASTTTTTSESTEPVRDPPPVEAGSPKDHQPSMAQRAKGFISPEEGDNNVDMAAVLSGMGALPHEPPMPVSLSSSL